MKRNINIKDIAKLSGVGTSTVSRVLNHHSDVNEDTRKKVLTVIEKYNYVPNNSARNLKRQISNNIGILVKGIYNPFFSKMINEIQRSICKEDFSTILHYNSDNDDDVDEAISFSKEKKLRGLICLGGNFERFDDDRLKIMGIPIVFCMASVSNELNKNLYSSVSINNKEALRVAVKKIVSMGHRKIGFIDIFPGDQSVCRFRIDGYIEALEETNIGYDERHVEIGDYTFESGFSAMEKLLEKDLGITVVFAISDIVAIGGAKAAVGKGYRIPDDISIVGFDGIDFAEYFIPSLTTIKQPSDEMAISSARMIFDMINNSSFNGHKVFETEIVIRESLKGI
jgi:LacI family transcriptional regulator